MTLRLDHINISVKNLDKSINWYQTIFGFQKVEEGVNHIGAKWAILAFNDSMIAMSEYTHRKDPIIYNVNAENHAIFHFGIRIDNIEDWRSKVKLHNLKLYYGGEVKYPFSVSWYIHDPTGHEIEVSYSEGKPLRFVNSMILEKD